MSKTVEFSQKQNPYSFSTILTSNNFSKKKFALQNFTFRTNDFEPNRPSQVHQSRIEKDERKDWRMTLCVQIYQVSPGFSLRRCCRYQPSKTRTIQPLPPKTNTHKPIQKQTKNQNYVFSHSFHYAPEPRTYANTP